MRKWPSPSVVTILFDSVAMLITVTVAPGMIAPLESTTTPDSVPVGPDWASEVRTGAHRTAMSRRTIALRILKFAVNIIPLLLWKLV
jgi:hypothetical protein